MNWRKLKPGMFFLLDSGKKHRFLRTKRDYQRGKAMTALIQIMNTHQVNGRVATIYLKTHAIRNHYNPYSIQPTVEKHLTSEIHDPDRFFANTKIILLK